MIIAHVVAAADAERQRVLDDWLGSTEAVTRAVVVEGWQPLETAADVTVATVGAGCLCCVGQLPLKIALIRLIREKRPQSLLVLLKDAAHLPRLRALLADGTLGVRIDVR